MCALKDKRYAECSPVCVYDKELQEEHQHGVKREGHSGICIPPAFTSSESKPVREGKEQQIRIRHTE